MQWRPVVGFEGLYEVSSEGRVRSLRRERSGPHYSNGGIIRERELRHWFTKGYPCVSMRKDGGTFKSPVHLLVASAFLGPRPEGMETCHNDGNRNNPAASNLRFDTYEGNRADTYLHGTDRRGERNHSSVLTDEQVLAIRADARVQRTIAADYGIKQQCVSKIKRRLRWAHLP